MTGIEGGTNMRIQFRRIGAVLILLALAALQPTWAAKSPNYVIEIIKSKQTLLVKHGNRIAKRFHVALGSGGPGDKRHRGDDKTPIGVYRIVKFRDSDKFFMFMMLNYPNVKDAFFGLKDKVIDRSQFDKIINAVKEHKIPPQNTRLGGFIGIHGLGQVDREKLAIHEHYNWTQGCIALTNAQIEDLRHYVGIGTKVVINE